MFTIFDFFELVALVVGAILGMRYGISWFGIVGGIVGFFAGALAALAIGRLPLVIALLFMRRSLTKTSNETLRERLQTQYYISHILLAHLMERGEDVTTEIPLFLDWMRS
ncbi:MAG: hypothetical protein LBU11_09670 [Zoogloeaceae bacterium]|jgi:hypothetical protein|nr:hypothetical protein [Zoogloeaceae bacterium]